MKKSKYIIILIFLLFSSSPLYSQIKKTKKIFGKEIQNANNPNNSIRCVTTEYENHLQNKFPKRATTEEFEQWLAPKIEKIKSERDNQRTTNVIINIPVVVHVIHNGDAYGTGENITDEQVISQIIVLNQDFRKMINTPGYNTNTVGADIEVEFCLAQQDPSGNATNGINRVNLNTASFGESAVENTLKPQTQWDPTRYFNIWVCRFGGDLDGILGYAQFPDSSGLGGLNTSGGNANTDGVIIGYQYFGSSTIYPQGTYEAPYNKGRTTTHEIGHCFGLRHIWGDNSSCTVNATDSNKDYCPDTPAANTAHYGCETGSNTCTAAAGNDMVENYMDYSDDSCMNIFTTDQKARILAVLQNSPRRASLTTSNACSPAQVYNIDGSIKIESLNGNCETTFSPIIKIENKGVNNLTSATLSYNFDGLASQTLNWTGNLTTNQGANITLPSVTLTSGSHTFTVSIVSTNNTTDQNVANNTKIQTFTIISSYNTTQVVINLQRDRYGAETTWTLKTSSGATVASGGPYTNTSSLPALISQTITVNNNTCYTFTINDTENDGICCDYGSGYYNLKTLDNITIASGGEFTDIENKNFYINTSLGTNDYSSTNNVSIYPNPASEMLTISIKNAELPKNYRIYNSLCQLLTEKTIKKLEDLTIDTSSLSNGVYFINIFINNETKSIKFIKN